MCVWGGVGHTCHACGKEAVGGTGEKEEARRGGGN